MATDPVCNMDVDEKTAEHKTEYKGEIYYFCAPGCKTAFEEDPEKYLKGEKAAMEGMPEKKWWQIWK
ncbi:MAG: YHS domain-containing protein [Candidatus Hydrothermarchaeales archaeon]